MKAHFKLYPIKLMCRVLMISISSYYRWLIGKPSPRAQRDLILSALVKAAHQRTRETYGNERLHAELVSSGVDISLHKVRQLRSQHGLRCKQRRRFKCTTNSDHDKPIAPNLLKQQFTAERPNQAWSSDITYVWTKEGWLYMAGVKDLYSKEIVGYAISSRMTTDLCLKALAMAIKRRKPEAGLIVHSDRGSQYCSHLYRQYLDHHHFACSMSRRGNCYDNAPIESFWGSLKNELIHQTQYETREQARREIVEWIEIFYNRVRRHTKLGNISPAEAFNNFMLQAA